MDNLTIFDCLYPKYKITKPIRLIELFAGIGSQAKALKNLKVNFEHYKIVDIDKYAITSYNAIHNTNFKPLDITKIHANDLEIVDIDKYEYIMTYSFPCQDLSLAGKGKGMAKDSGTRSSLLWEVERILKECEELPQILLMENVPEVIGEKNIQYFQEWQLFLEKIGYSNYIDLLNAKNYGIPQNRNRCFMISILGDYNYTFPKPIKLNLKLKDMLEDEVDRKYYLTKEKIKQISNWKSYQDPLKDIDKEKIICPTLTARGAEEEHSGMILINEATLKEYDNNKDKYMGTFDYNKSDTFIGNKSRYKLNNDIISTIKTNGGDDGIIENITLCLNSKDENGKQPSLQNRIYDTNAISTAITTSYLPNYLIKQSTIRKLTPKECWRLMGFSDEDFEKASKVNNNTQLYKQAGNSIVVNVLEAIFKELII